ncbi:MAG: PepSY domain-containing protein [Methylococcaceae bacterium]|nr:PepSY domain-containing protein [Methylococcaceae bacterium]
MKSTVNRSPSLLRLQTRRKRWLQVHLYLGLFAGAILAVVGFTGSILVFFEELQEILNAEQIVISAPPESLRNILPLDEIIAAAETVKPKGSKFYSIYYPRKPEFAYKLQYRVRAPEQDNNGSGYYIFVNPYTAEVTGVQFWYFADGKRYWGIPFVSFIMQLHYCLVLGDTGETAVGILAALSIISVLSGLILWWPLTGKFKQALTFKRHASAVRFNFDLHKIVGFYTTLVLLPVLFSGVYFNLPDRVNVVFNQFSPITRDNPWSGLAASGFTSTKQLGQKPVSYAALEAAVQNRYPSGRLWHLYAPKNEKDNYIIQKRDAGDLSSFVGYRDFLVDQYNGKILATYQAGTGNNGDVFLDWQWPLHSGQAFGWTGRILVFLSGLACPILYVTGVIRWLQKRNAHKVHKNKYISI